MNLTTEERERRAYVTGDTATAELLGAIIDCETEQLDEMEHEVRELKDEVSGLEADVERLEAELEKSETDLAELKGIA